MDMIINKFLVKYMFLAGVFYMLIFASCSSSNMIHKSWVAPGLKPSDIDFKEIVILALVPNNNHKRIIEDEIAKRIVDRIAVPAHKIFEREELKEHELLREKLLDRGVDGALIVRLLDSEQRSYYMPGNFPVHYYQFTDYYGYSYGYIFDPGGRLQYETEVNLEINIFSLTDDKIIWSGHTTTYLQDKIEEMVGPYMRALAEELNREGLLEMDHTL